MNELSTLPNYEAKRFMLWVAKVAESYFEDPDVKERFEKWKIERVSYKHSGNPQARG